MTDDPAAQKVRDALVALGTDLGDLPAEVTSSQRPELAGRLLASAYAQLRDLPEDLDVETENARIAAAYQEVMASLGDERTVAFEAAFAALRHFSLVIASLDVEATDPLMTAAVQLMQVTAMACGVAFLAPNQVLLSDEERKATGETLQEEIAETFGSLRVLERAARRMAG